MKITAISIFPEYFSPLELSLIGKARSQSLIDFKSINLRDFTTDNHHSVDDTPYGGGAGMVMMAEPWGQTIDSILEKDGEIGKDDLARGEKELEKITSDHVAKIDELLKHKEAELLEV